MKERTEDTDTSDLSIYDLPLLTSDRCGHVRCCSYMPFLPTHKERPCCPCTQRNKMVDEDGEDFVYSNGSTLDGVLSTTDDLSTRF